MKNIRLVVVSTTAYSEENFSLITDLTDEQIKNIEEMFGWKWVDIKK